jgi:exo-beta-1,3-glucanase (GH17 family)
VTATRVPSLYVSILFDDTRWLNASGQLEAIKQTKVDMTVYLGNYAIPDDSNAAYNRQRDAIQAALQTYGTDHVFGITVGNEYMLKYIHSTERIAMIA